LNRTNLSIITINNETLRDRRTSGGPRHEISTRLVLRSDTNRHDAWALNISKGGIRVITEGSTYLGQILDVEECHSDSAGLPSRRARVVWARNEPDGSIVGLEFADSDPANSNDMVSGGRYPKDRIANLADSTFASRYKSIGN